MNPHCARLPADAEKHLCCVGLQSARSIGVDILTFVLMVGDRWMEGGGLEKERKGGGRRKERRVVVKVMNECCCRVTFFVENPR